MARRSASYIRRSGGDSACVASWSYDKRSETLHIDFNKRGGHTYTAVPESLVDAFQKTGSKGRFFNFFIRDGGFG